MNRIKKIVNNNKILTSLLIISYIIMVWWNIVIEVDEWLLIEVVLYRIATFLAPIAAYIVIFREVKDE